MFFVSNDRNVYKVEHPLAVWFALGKDMGKVNLLDFTLDEKDILNLIR